MTLQQAIDILRRHNEWRRYDGPLGAGPKETDPKALGDAIAAVVASLDGGLHTGDYPLAEGFTMSLSNRTIHVKPKVRPEGYKPDGDRCCDCKARRLGRCFAHRHYKTFVCTKKPKGDGIYYGAPHYQRACYMFEKKGK